jgi:uncharacterized membrane protein
VLTDDETTEKIRSAFIIGDQRTFDDDPRFGFLTLSEIAIRALSPAVNDPGTAIDVLGSMVRLLARFAEPIEESERLSPRAGNVAVPELCIGKVFDDAFTTIARDGAGNIEVVERLLRSLESLALTGDDEMRSEAERHARLALLRAENVLEIDEDIRRAREAASFSGDGNG